MMQELDLTKRVDVLDTLLQGLAPVSIAFSGGFDSRFITFMAVRLGLEVDLFHIVGPHMSASESAWARSWADTLDVPFHEVSLNPFAIPAVASGAPDRCYACKHALFSCLREMIEEESTLCDGSTASDAELHRPGARALQELDVRSPLAEAMLTKDECRHIALTLGMDRPWQAARPCLLTRLPYNLAPSPIVLAQIDAMEDVARHVFALCYPELEEVPDFRIRLLPTKLDRLDQAGVPVSPQSQGQEAVAPLHMSPEVLPRAQDQENLKVSPETLHVPYVLHVVADVAPSVVEALVAAYIAEQLPVPQVFAMQSLSGYFDTKSAPSL